MPRDDDLTDEQRDQLIVEHYKRHKPVYDNIEQKLEEIRELIDTGPRDVAETVLFLADVYALISSQTHVDAHELSFVRVAHSQSMAEIRTALEETRAHGGSEAVLFHNNKAEYIKQNLREVDYGHQLDLYRDREIDELHRYKVDEVAGVGMNKAGFALAMSGITEKMCVDGNVARFFGLDANDKDDVPSNTVVVARWDQFCKDLRRRAPTLIDEHGASNYIWQWVTFDVRRENGVETHDPWFLTVHEASDGSLISPNAQL